MMIEGRNIDEAAKRVADMSDEDVLLFAQRDPDMFRHVALGYRAVKLDAPTEQQIKHMAHRFLGWRLPENFNPDAGISFKAAFNEHTAHPMKHQPTGTNLFDAQQAEAMVRYMVEEPMLTDEELQPARIVSEL